MKDRLELKLYAIIGGLGRDIYIRVRSFRQDLPSVFIDHIGESIKYSEIPQKFGPDWDVKRLIQTLDIEHRSSSYGGRAAHIAYQVSLLGGKAILVTEAGEDVDYPYDGFYERGYFTHLKNAKVMMDELRLDLPEEEYKNPDELKKFLEDRYAPEIFEKGFLIVNGKSIPTIPCASCEFEEGNIYFIDDRNAANIIQNVRPIPVQIINIVDGVFLTTCESTEYMKSMIDAAVKLDKEILMDIACRVESPFLRESLPKVNIIFGNSIELKKACSAFGIETVTEKPSDMAKLFDAMKTSKTRTIIVWKKDDCSATILQRSGECAEVGPIDIPERDSNVGCCDGMGAGF